MRKIKINGVIVSNDVQWIYDLFDIDSVSPKNVEEELSLAENDEVEVTINSGGGEVFAGSEIYTMLKNHPRNVTTQIVGIGASAASVIAMAGNKVSMAPTAQMMIHNVSSVTAGDYNEMEHTADMLKGANRSIANAYRLKSGMEEQEILDLMNKETWFTAQEAKEKNLIDEIMFDNAAQPTLVASSANTEVLPPQVINRIREEYQNQGGGESAKPKNKEEDEYVDLEKLKNEHPELYKQIKEEGYEEGVNAENSRMKALEDLDIPGSEEMVNKAKYETKATAEQTAMDIIKAQKQSGQTNFNQRMTDAGELDKVQGSATPQGGEQEQVNKTANLMAGIVNKSRGGVK